MAGQKSSEEKRGRQPRREWEVLEAGQMRWRLAAAAAAAAVLCRAAVRCRCWEALAIAR
jgi:hypothetical protein